MEGREAKFVHVKALIYKRLTDFLFPKICISRTFFSHTSVGRMMSRVRLPIKYPSNQWDPCLKNGTLSLMCPSCTFNLMLISKC